MDNIMALFATVLGPLNSQTGGATSGARKLVRLALASYEAGDFESAVSSLDDAVDLFADEGDDGDDGAQCEILRDRIAENDLIEETFNRR